MRATGPCLCGDPACPWCGSGYRQPEEIAEDLAVALGWAEPSRWEIGRLCLELQDVAGDDALWQAVPEGSERLARTCMRVVSRWPAPLPGDSLEFGHYRRCQHLDDAAAARALALARGGGWTPAQLGRYLAGFSPDEPGVADMLTALLTDGSVLVFGDGDGWRIGMTGPAAPSIGAAIRAAWRARYGAGGAS